MIEHYPFQNTPLPYPYNALEPYIDSETMHLHHDAHLKGYVDSLNTVLEKYPALQNKTLEQLLLLPTARPMPRMNSSLMNTSQMNSPQMNSSPMRSRRGAVNPPMQSQPIQNRPMTPEDREKLRRSAGGVYNHRLFFNSMAPTAKRQPRGQLAAAIACDCHKRESGRSARNLPASESGRLGARLLSQARKSARRLHRRLVERSQFPRRRSPLSELYNVIHPSLPSTIVLIIWLFSSKSRIFERI